MAQSWVRDVPVTCVLRLCESHGPLTNNHSKHLITQPPLTFQGLVEMRRDGDSQPCLSLPTGFIACIYGVLHTGQHRLSGSLLAQYV